jgi:hypothetical protein
LELSNIFVIHCIKASISHKSQHFPAVLGFLP